MALHPTRVSCAPSASASGRRSTSWRRCSGASPASKRACRRCEMMTEPLATPDSVGMDPRKIDDLQRQVKQQLATGLSPGTQVVVARHAQVVRDMALGMARADPPAPVTHDTLFYSWSVAKPVTAMAVHLLIERGQLALDDPLVKYWPEFGRHGKERVLVRHVLAHRAGFPLPP